MPEVFNPFTLNPFGIGAGGKVAEPSLVPLFEGGRQGLWYNLAPDQSPVYQTHDGMTPSGLGDPVGYFGDLSPNGNHATQPISMNRPAVGLDSAGRRRVICDADDFLKTIQPISTGPTTLALAYDPSDLGNYFIALTSDQVNAYVALADIAPGTSTTIGNSGPIQAIWVDGVSVPLTGLTRGGLWSAIASGSVLIVHWNNSTASLRRLGRWNVSNQYYTHHFSQFLLIDKYLDNNERALVDIVMRIPS